METSRGPHKKYNPKGDLVLDIVFEDGIQINIKDSLNVVNLDKIIDFLDKLPTEKFDFSLVRSQCESIASVCGMVPKHIPGSGVYRYVGFRLYGMEGLGYFAETASYMLNMS